MSSLEVTPTGHVIGAVTPGNSRRQLVTVGFGALIAASALLLAQGKAAADPHSHDEYLVCTAIAANPTVSGVNDVALSWIAQVGPGPENAKLGARVMWDAVTQRCPEYQSLVLAWAATPTPAAPITTGGTAA